MNFHRADFATGTQCAVIALLAVALAGCTEPRGPLSVKSDDPTLKIPAIERDVQQKNTSDVAQLVKDLNDDDSAVRFYAIEGLRRLTGDDFGYHYWDDEDARRPAVQRWNKWLKDRGGK
jgi:hypothetical protein